MSKAEERAKERQSKIEKALEESRKQREKNETSRDFRGGGSNYQFEEVKYTSLSQDQGRVVRLLGTPFDARGSMEEELGDPKLFYYSMILNDEGNKFRCIWENDQDNPDWIMWKIFRLVTKGRWNNEKREKEFFYKDSHPECFRRVRFNNNMENPYERGWYPQKLVAWNVIDRHDEAWHKENKHTKVLSKRVGNDGKFYEPGIPFSLYEMVRDEIIEHYKDAELYDVVIKKKKSSPFYSVKHGIVHAPEIGTAEKSLVKEGYLTDEEFEYKKYDFNKIYPITSYSKIKYNLGRFIRKVDADFNTNFSEELDELVEKEKKLREEMQSKTTEQVPENPVTSSTSSSKTREVEVRERKTSSAKDIPWEDLANGNFNGTTYKGVPLLTDEEKSQIKGINPDGSFDYVSEWNGQELVLLRNNANGFISPNTFHVCPLSGEVWND